MKNKYIKLMLKISLLCIGFFIGYKFYYLYKYNVSSRTIKNYDAYIKFLSETENITIDSKTEEFNDYLKFNNIKIRNDWGNSLELMEDNTYSHKYVAYDENRNLLYSIWIGGPEENIVDTLIKDSKNADNGTYKKYYEENDIYDVISLFKYLTKNKDKKINIFTSTREIEWFYTMNVVPAAIFENATDLKFIDGSHRGIMYTRETNNQKSVLIIKDGKTYIIEFFGLDYFKDEYIKELLETLIIENI